MKNKRFCKKLNEALADEHKAPKDYSKLSASTSSKAVKQAISRISRQEKHHFKILKSIKRNKCL